MVFKRGPEPHEVFTPGSPPLEEHNVYVNRTTAETALKKHVQRHHVPVVWGEYGVGKTSLVQRYFQPAASDGRLIYIASVASLALTDVFSAILEHLDYSVDINYTTSDRVSGSVGFDAKVLKATLGAEGAGTKTSQLVVTSPTDTGMKKLLHEKKLTVVLDEMHKASQELRGALVDWIKATRVDAKGFTLVLVGTSTDAGRLVALDKGIDRYVREMPVDLMSGEEARYIVDEGFRRLGLTVDAALRERLISSAAGAPTIVQALCLDAAESASQAERNQVTEQDLKFAVAEYLKENSGRLYDHYFRAIETTGERRYRKQVLRAVASTPNDYATMEDIKTGVSNSLDLDVPASSLSGPLRDLKTPRYGNILKDVDRDVSGARIHNLTAFTDPMMKSYVRFMNNLDETGLMPPAPVRRVDAAEPEDSYEDPQ